MFAQAFHVGSGSLFGGLGEEGGGRAVKSLYLSAPDVVGRLGMLGRLGGFGGLGTFGDVGGRGNWSPILDQGFPLTPDAAGKRTLSLFREIWASYLAFCSGFVRTS